jgi:hypothetical protein
MTKKLEANGLWESSRMMLPQHKEQSMSTQNQTPAPAAKPPTRKELELMRECIILPIALKIVEQKSMEVGMSSQTLRPLYLAATKILGKHIREDVRQSKKALLESDIRVFEDTKDDTSLYYRYVCRGREDAFIITRDFMRSAISARIGNYAKSLIAMLQETAKNK